MTAVIRHRRALPSVPPMVKTCWPSAGDLHARIERHQQRRIDEHHGVVVHPAPAIGRHRFDLAVEGISRRDGAHLHETRVPRGFGQRHRREIGHTGVLHPEGAQRIDQRVHHGGKCRTRLECHVATQQGARLFAHRARDIARERIDGHERGHPEGDGRHVQRQTPARRPAFTPGQASRAPTTCRARSRVCSCDVLIVAEILDDDAVAQTESCAACAPPAPRRA